MRDVRNCPLLIQMHIQTVLSKVPSHHLPRRNDAMLLREMFLAKDFSVLCVGELLPHEFVLPFFGLIAGLAGDSGYNEGHIECVDW
ncbi:hypothetical protein VFPPC_05410 [Pochonia chlamydosporia 170]|uniref:Uncharacterized protein n=1 Tax=Pochonia chlamydosporia 170 TaxID=1380566 RepID=A0A179FF88_METCM|nr:hypothetical protein VFPPC_05410 [Pochonia chlamydosporia 170]OAQ64067.1 hypothetical protein VFPPC_05410 [Pochonia chlamydosporia 170]